MSDSASERGRKRVKFSDVSQQSVSYDLSSSALEIRVRPERIIFPRDDTTCSKNTENRWTDEFETTSLSKAHWEPSKVSPDWTRWDNDLIKNNDRLATSKKSTNWNGKKKDKFESARDAGNKSNNASWDKQSWSKAEARSKNKWVGKSTDNTSWKDSSRGKSPKWTDAEWAEWEAAKTAVVVTPVLPDDPNSERSLPIIQSSSKSGKSSDNTSWKDCSTKKSTKWTDAEWAEWEAAKTVEVVTPELPELQSSDRSLPINHDSSVWTIEEWIEFHQQPYVQF